VQSAVRFCYCQCILTGSAVPAGWFGLRADAAWARLATDSGAETVDGRSAAWA